MKHDTSCVFSIYMLDEESRADFSPEKPWIFEIKDELFNVHEFRTEAEACEAQRLYREERGFDPITGNK